MEGFSPDFALANVLGFACLAVYYCSFHFSSQVQDLYRYSLLPRSKHGCLAASPADCWLRRKRYGTSSGVRSNDVAFAVHALVLTSLTLGQYVYYGNLLGDVSWICLAAVSAAASGALLWGLCALTYAPGSVLALLYALSAVKLAVTASKYAPQVRAGLHLTSSRLAC